MPQISTVHNESEICLFCVATYKLMPQKSCLLRNVSDERNCGFAELITVATKPAITKLDRLQAITFL